MKQAGGMLGLKVIGAFKLTGGLLTLVVAISLVRLFKTDVTRALEHIVWAMRLDPHNHVIHALIHRVSGIDHKYLRAFEVGTFFYAFLHIIEGTGLLLAQRWAEYLTVVATSSLVPFEAFELIRRPRPVKIVVLVINIAIVIYLIVMLSHRNEREAAEQAAAAKKRDS